MTSPETQRFMTSGPSRPWIWLVLGIVLPQPWRSRSSSGWPALPLPTLGPPADLPPDEAVAATGPAWFRDVTAASGLDFTYRNGEEADQYAILESLGGGVALIDYDGDGLLDLFVTGGGYFDGPDKADQGPCPASSTRTSAAGSSGT